MAPAPSPESAARTARQSKIVRSSVRQLAINLA